MARQAEPDPPQSLTPREEEVLELLRSGLADSQIAQRLGISSGGVGYHVSEIIGKLGVNNRHEAAAWPERPPWWATGFAPVALFWRKTSAALPVKASSVAIAISGGVLAAALGGLALIAFLAAPGDDGQAVALPPLPLSPPQEIAGPPPTLTPVPLPLEPTSGTLVYLRGDDLWVVSLDGGRSVPPRAITSDSLGTWYVGHVRGTDGEIDLFYARQLTEPFRSVSDFALYRVGLDGGTPEELLQFADRRPIGASDPTSVSVSPDGQYVAHADEDGLLLQSLSSGDVSRLLENGCDGPDEPNVTEPCWEYGPSVWSPDGSVLQVDKSSSGGRATSVLVRPFDLPPDVTETPYSGTAHWSPDGERICMRREVDIQIQGPVVVYDVRTGEALDTSLNISNLPVTEEGRPLWTTLECAWSQQGWLALHQVDFGSRPNLNSVLVLDADLNVVARTEGRALVGWLPDGSGVLLNRGPQHEPLSPVIYLPGSGMFELPFEADFALGVIP